MKIELLKNSFRGVTRHEETALAALAILPRKRRTLPVAGRHFDVVNETALASNEDLMTHIASTFDPQRMTRVRAEVLIELLKDSELLSFGDAQQLSAALRLSVMPDSTLDLYKFLRANLPASAVKSRLIDLLDNVISRRYRAAG